MKYSAARTGEESGEPVDGDWTGVVGEWLHAAARGPVPQDVLHAAARQTFDSVACAFGGASHEAAGIALGVARSLFAGDECSLIGEEKGSSLMGGILYNCTVVRALDCNDVYFDYEPLGHPSDNLPAALLVAEARGANGVTYLRSVAIGYELDWRLQAGLRRASQGGWLWDYTSVSPLVTAAMTGLLLDLDARRLGEALAIAATRSLAAGILRSGGISMLKACAGALGAGAGLQAAFLAAGGMTGPPRALEGAKGLLHCMATDAAAEVCESLVAPIDSWHIREVGVKQYPAIGTSQGAIDATLRLVTAHRIDPEDIESIEVRLPDTSTIREHMEDVSRSAPETRETADHSIPFIIAVCVEDKEFGLDQFENRRWQRPTTRALMGRIRQVPDARLNQYARFGSPAAVAIRLTDSHTIQTETLAVPGTPPRPLTDDELGDKLDHLCGRSLSPEYQAGLKRRLLQLEAETNMSNIGLLIRGPATDEKLQRREREAGRL